MPLEGIVSPQDATGPITIHAGASPVRNLEHHVGGPVQVWVELSEKGAEQALEIVSDDGTRRSGVPHRALRNDPTAASVLMRLLQAP